MKNSDFLKPSDSVTVTVFGQQGNRLYQHTDTGYHNIEAAIKAAVSVAPEEVNPEDCVFEVTNRQTAVSHRYRLNAHGNLKLIV